MSWIGHAFHYACLPCFMSKVSHFLLVQLGITWHSEPIVFGCPWADMEIETVRLVVSWFGLIWGDLTNAFHWLLEVNRMHWHLDRANTVRLIISLFDRLLWSIWFVGLSLHINGSSINGYKIHWDCFIPIHLCSLITLDVFHCGVKLILIYRSPVETDSLNLYTVITILWLY